MRSQPIKISLPLFRAPSVTFYMLACNGERWRTYTNAAFLLSHRHNWPSKLKFQTVGTSTCGCNSNTIFSRNNYFHVSYRRHMPCLLIWQQVSIGYACKSRNMAALLNSLFFVFKIFFFMDRLSRALKLRTYQLAVCSTLTHASEAWTLAEPVMRSVNGFNSRCLHIVTGQDYRVTAIAPEYDLILAIRQRRLRYLGHILRMPESRGQPSIYFPIGAHVNVY